MYAILAEDRSDVEVLKQIVRKLAGDQSITIKGIGYGGYSRMVRKGSEQLRAFHKYGCNKFVVCLDADGPDDAPHRDRVRTKIVNPSGLGAFCCIVIPVQEIEAWILADLEAAHRIFPSWKPEPIANPERIPSPKEHLEKLSRDSGRRPRYIHATDNPRIAPHLDLAKLEAKCPSFRGLAEFVRAKASPPKTRRRKTQ